VTLAKMRTKTKMKNVNYHISLYSCPKEQTSFQNTYW